MDASLVQRAQQGDEAAFTLMAEAIVGRLERTARLILRDEDRAADAVQEALVAAWLDIRALRDPARFEAWLGRVLVRSCYRLAGKERRRSVVEIHVAGPEGADDDDAHRHVENQDLIARAFDRLTTDQRAALVMHHHLGLRDGEAADMLGIALGTYKSRLNRATIALRASLEAEDRAPLNVRRSSV
jgi:RNA polymerase sigma-70 factor (ECF subfamily)